MASVEWPRSKIAATQAGPGLDMGRFKQKVRRFLDAHRDHISLQKLRRAEQLTRQDIEELERIFVPQGVGDSARLAELRQEGGLGVFLSPPLP